MNCSAKKIFLSLFPAGALLSSKIQCLFGRCINPSVTHRHIITACKPPPVKDPSVSATFGQPTHLTHPHRIQKGEIVPGIQTDEFRLRRNRLLESIKSYCYHRNFSTRPLLIVIPSSYKKYMTEKIPYVFRQNSDFLYLTGCLEQDSILVITCTEKKCKSLIFIRGRDPHSELWDGPRTGVDQAPELFGVDSSLPAKEFGPFIQSFMKDNQDCMLWYDYLSDIHPEVHRVMQQYLSESWNKKTVELISSKDFLQVKLVLETDCNLSALTGNNYRNRLSRSEELNLKKVYVKGAFVRIWESPKPFIHRLRLYKSPAEQELMKKSCQIASQAIKNAMRASRPWDNEAFIQARVDFDCRMNGAEYLAYPPVVASGDRANIIHYIDNNQIVEDGDLVLMDAGCEYHSYCSDITRTWPISGKFSPEQRVLYEVLYSVQTELIQMCCKFPTLDQLFTAMNKLLKIRLVDAGIMLSKSGDDGNQSVQSFCPHHVSHYLGMDVHDTSSVPRHIPMEPGMVITIEPGAYISKDNKYANPMYRGLGIRIEDDILMTDSGPLVLTSSCPKHPDEIEKLCNC